MQLRKTRQLPSIPDSLANFLNFSLAHFEVPAATPPPISTTFTVIHVYVSGRFDRVTLCVGVFARCRVYLYNLAVGVDAAIAVGVWWVFGCPKYNATIGVRGRGVSGVLSTMLLSSSASEEGGWGQWLFGCAEYNAGVGVSVWGVSGVLEFIAKLCI